MLLLPYFFLDASVYWLNYWLLECMLLLVSTGVGFWGFLLRYFGVCIGGFVGLVGCRCRYCRLRCSILVAMRHGQVMLCSLF